mgnify:CR=1 FL=1
MIERSYWKFAFLISLSLMIFNIIQLTAADFWLQLLAKLTLEQILAVFPPSLAMRILLTLFLVTTANALVAACFRTTSRWYALAFVLYVFSFTLTFHPALLQSQHHISKLFKFLAVLGGPTLFLFFAAFLFLVLAALLFRNWRQREDKRRLALQSLLLVGAAWFLFYFNNPLISYRPSSPIDSVPKKAWSKPDIFLLGVDGLRPDIFYELVSQGRFPALSRFLEKSFRFSNAVSPIARTHPAFHSVFHGKPPSQLSIRTNNSHRSLDSDLALNDSHIGRLKSEGYFVEIGLTDTSHSSYRRGQLIDSVKTPPIGAYNIALPHFFKDLAIWALFNNSLGLKIIPELIGNSAFSDTYRHEHFLRAVAAAFDQSQVRTQPTFALYHNIALHWPGSSHYPDFTCDRGSATCFRYGTHLELTSASAFSLEIDRLRNIDIYRRNLNRLLEDYLEPLFENLEQRGLFANDSQATVILLSDHGETFYSDKFLPMGKAPNHGALAGLDDDSHESVLAIRLPQSAQKIPESVTRQPFPLYDIFPLIQATRSQEKHDIALFKVRQPQLESDRWLTPLFPYQGLQLPFGNGFSAYEFDTNGDVVLREDLEGLVNFSKNVGYVDDEGTHVSFLAEYGFFGSKLKPLDQGNQNDRLHELRRLANSLSGAKIDQLLSEEPAKNSDLAYVHALDLLYRQIDPSRSLSVLKKIYASSDAPKPLVEMALIHISRLCTLASGSVGDSALRFMQAIDLGNGAQNFTFHYEALRSQFLCFAAHGEKRDADRVMRFVVRHYFDDLLRRPIGGYFWNFSASQNRAVRSLNEEVAELTGDLKRLSAQEAHLTDSEFDQLVKSLKRLRNADVSEVDIANETKSILKLVQQSPHNQMYGALDPWFYAAIDTQIKNRAKMRILLIETLKGYKNISYHLMVVIGNVASHLRLIDPETVSAFWRKRESTESDPSVSARTAYAEVLLRELEAANRK